MAIRQSIELNGRRNTSEGCPAILPQSLGASILD
jgi:hypothetical protein